MNRSVNAPLCKPHTTIALQGLSLESNRIESNRIESLHCYCNSITKRLGVPPQLDETRLKLKESKLQDCIISMYINNIKLIEYFKGFIV